MWGQHKIGNVKLLMRVATWVIQRLDIAQGRRTLEREETWLRCMLKQALLGLATLERMIDRQRSRLRWIKEGDTNTKLFQAVANSRRTKNFISHVTLGDDIITDQERKVDVFSVAYEQLLGTVHAREHTLDLHYLGIEATDLQSLEDIITEEEVWQVIKELPPDHAPGPNGFIGAFYQRAWQIIKLDIMAVMMKLFMCDARGFSKLNKAHIILIPKKLDMEEIGDFRPISLIHSIPKLFAKELANRLRIQMHEIVAMNQSTFIKGRHLHDNFFLVRQVARRIHARRVPRVFIKLDISRAFDSLSWSFLFEVLRAKGFGQRWAGWMAALLQSASTKVVVNGVPREEVCTCLRSTTG